MKKTMLLNAELSQLIAAMGHGDQLVIADAGLPVPPGTRCIDLAVSGGVPSFDQVLLAVLSELQVESAVAAGEMLDRSPALAGVLRARLGAIPLAHVDHGTFKARSAGARAIVRTGEFTPYANVILSAGVVF
ncbi:D-ribose pyranase [Piscinibacter gummiphilus]|uniref:D-ribose pyranase n=1 Tax=Piscinibacter gummiphilus TaxID=946333 RepID=A0A1W6LAU6_9BURK|nr:D-ribose pyranase [Piscinibacter gummiphilus]ARN21356.1 D-ribose pyranase [Piscinibacter gummiphilus]ATU66042.1 D-ribose pyranase [Piscinibacter gummiphilus]GLS96299.1 D-ribose pyranase [Piscinibacter gummiphilus]